MRRPKASDFDRGDGTTDYEEYDSKMCDYEDAQRDEEIERRMDLREDHEPDNKKGELNVNNYNRINTRNIPWIGLSLDLQIKSTKRIS